MPGGPRPLKVDATFVDRESTNHSVKHNGYLYPAGEVTWELKAVLDGIGEVEEHLCRCYETRGPSFFARGPWQAQLRSALM